MSAQIQTGGLLFHCQQLGACVFLDIGYPYAYRRGILEVGLAEEIELPLDVVAALLLDTVDHNARDLQQRPALVAHAVKGSGADQILDRTAVELLSGHTAAEILEAAEGSVLLASGDKLVYEASAYAFYCDKAEADIVAAD